MTRSKFSEHQVIGTLKQVEGGRTVAEVCREVYMRRKSSKFYFSPKV